jgi:hypothetical protein
MCVFDGIGHASKANQAEEQERQEDWGPLRSITTGYSGNGSEHMIATRKRGLSDEVHERALKRRQTHPSTTSHINTGGPTPLTTVVFVIVRFSLVDPGSGWWREHVQPDLIHIRHGGGRYNLLPYPQYETRIHDCTTQFVTHNFIRTPR